MSFLLGPSHPSPSSQLGRTSPSLQSLSICYTSAIQTLELITRQFAPWGLLVRSARPPSSQAADSAFVALRAGFYERHVRILCSFLNQGEERAWVASVSRLPFPLAPPSHRPSPRAIALCVAGHS